MEARTLSEIDRLNKEPMTDELLHYITQQASSVVPIYQTGDTGYESAFSISTQLCERLPPLSNFINGVVSRSKVKSGILLGSLVFLDQIKHILPPNAKGMPCTAYRVFLASLILATKTLNDISFKNRYWVNVAIHFSMAEVNLMEKQFLKLLDYQTWIKLDHMIKVYEGFSSSLLIRKQSKTLYGLYTKEDVGQELDFVASLESLSMSEETLTPDDSSLEERYVEYFVNTRYKDTEECTETTITVVDTDCQVAVIGNRNVFTRP